MANIIGHNQVGGFSEAFDDALAVLASKFTAPATFTPNFIAGRIRDQWGVGGTVYYAIYSDNSGAPDQILMTGSATYSSLVNAFVLAEIDTPAELTSSSVYWLAMYAENSGGVFNVTSTADTDAGNDVITWAESSAGSWTTTPSASSQTSDRKLSIYATDVLEQTKTHTTNALKYIVPTKTHSTDSYLTNLTEVTKTHTTDSQVQYVTTATWVTPEDEDVSEDNTPVLVFNMGYASFPMHFHIQLDKVDTFDGGDLTEIKSWENQAGWEYWDGDSWEAIPSTGVPSEFSGNQARYTVQAGLTVGTWYRRVRGRILRY